MARFFPDMTMSSAPDRTMCWEGPVTTLTGTEYQIRVQYSQRFPFQAPKAYVLTPEIKNTDHVHPEGYLHLNGRERWRWRQEATAATLTFWVCHWLNCYEVWQDAGEWPCNDHDVTDLDYHRQGLCRQLIDHFRGLGYELPEPERIFFQGSA